MTETHIAGELYGLSAHPGDIYHRAAMTVEALIRERDEARALSEDRADYYHAANEMRAERDAAEARIAKLEAALSQSAEWFQQYADSHTDKGDTDKAKRNQDRAAAAIRALKEPVASLRETGLTKPNCPNMEEGKHD
jgi:hypothetical protein